MKLLNIDLKLKLNLIFIISTLFVFNPVDLHSQNKYDGIAVVELFTSQGDVNCVEADDLLSELKEDAAKNNKPVYCLSMHVDFWNRLGWVDPYSSLKYTRRLQNYSSVLNEKETYTPKFIINGKGAGKKPGKAEIKKYIVSELNKPAKLKTEFTYQVVADTLNINYNINKAVSKSKNGSNWYINLAIVDNATQTKITKGGNAGKTLTNSNVVKLFHTSNLNEQNGTLRIPLKGLKKSDQRSVILFIQEKKSKAILGAAGKVFN